MSKSKAVSIPGEVFDAVVAPEKVYYVVWEKNNKVARIYNRKITAIYDHIRFKVKQKVWFLEGLSAAQVKERLKGVKVTYIREVLES